jgi:hypothetical protein
MKKQDWEIYQNNASKDILFTNIAYTQKEEKQEKLFERLADELGANHKLFLYSDYLDDTKQFEYRCAVFVDNENKQIVCANAGTRLKANAKGAHDLIDDAHLALELAPRKLRSAKTLNKTILDNLGPEASEYKFHFTGHSLGAAMAQIQATDLFLQLRNKNIQPAEISTITFDNPGTKPIIDEMLKKENLNPETIDISHIVVNNRPNFINTLNPQTGEVFEIEQEREPGIIQGVNANVRAGMDQNIQGGGRVFDFLKGKAFPLVCKVVSMFIPKIVKNIYEGCKWLIEGARQVKDHKLNNFENVIIKNQGRVLSRVAQDISLEHLMQPENQAQYSKKEYITKLFNEIKQSKEQGGNPGKQDFVIDNPLDAQERISYSLLELERAKKKVFQRRPELNRGQSGGMGR